MVLIITLVAFISLFKHIHEGYYYDDVSTVLYNPNFDSISRIPDYFVDPALFSGSGDLRMYRPGTLTAICLVNALPFGGAKSFHVAAILVHAMCSIMIFILARKLSGHTIAPLAAGLIFAAHPVAGEPVGYITAMGLPVSLAFILAAIYFSLEREASLFKGAMLPSLLAFAAMLTREDAAVYPALLALFLLAIPDVKNRRAKLVFAGATLAIYLALRLAVNIETIPAVTQDRSRLDNILTQCLALSHYLKLYLIPTSLSAENYFPSVRFGEMLSFAAMAAIAILLYACIRLFLSRGQYPFAFIGLLWFLVSLLPSSSVVVLNQVVNDRRAYLPLAGLLMALGAGKHFTDLLKGPTAKALTGLVIILLSLLNLSRGYDWQTETALFRDAVKKLPSSPRAFFGYAKALERSAQYERAIHAYNKTLSLSDDDHVLALNNLGTSLSRLGRREEAIEVFTKLTRAVPGYGLGHFNLGTELLQTGRLGEAIGAFRNTIKVQPDMANAHLNLGIAYLRTGRTREAITELEKAMELDPNIDYRTQLERLKRGLFTAH